MKLLWKYSALTFVLVSFFISRLADAQPLQAPEELQVRWHQADSLTYAGSPAAENKYKEAIQLSNDRFHEFDTRARVFLAGYYHRGYKTDLSRQVLNDLSRRALILDSVALGEFYAISAGILSEPSDVKGMSAYYDSALTVFEKIGDRLNTGKILRSIGIMYDLRDNEAIAIEYYNRALSIFKKTGDTRQIANVYNNIAIIYNDFYKSDDVALKFYDSAENLYRKINDVEGLAKIYNNSGLVFFDRRDFPAAKAWFERAIHESLKLPSPKMLGTSYRNMAWCLCKTGQYVQAEEMVLRALNIAEKLKSNFIYENGMETYIHILKATHRYEAALGQQEKLYVWRDSIYRQENEAKLRDLQVKYETRKKEKEIAEKNMALAHSQQIIQQQSLWRNILLVGIVAALLIAVFVYRNRQKLAALNVALGVKNQEIENQKRQIEFNLREKESLLREIHHRVKNNLQVISSLLNMQSYHLDDPRMISAITEGQNRVKAMALIHQKLYQTEQLSEIDFQEYTEQLIGHLAMAFGEPGKEIRSTVNGSNLKLDIDTAIPLGLILNELITNAYKYAFNGVTEGKLYVDLKQDDARYYHLHISDSGRGLPEDFNESKLNSLGLKLVRMLTEQLDGSLTISNEPGASFYIRFKESRMSA